MKKADEILDDEELIDTVYEAYGSAIRIVRHADEWVRRQRSWFD